SVNRTPLARGTVAVCLGFRCASVARIPHVNAQIDSLVSETARPRAPGTPRPCVAASIFEFSGNARSTPLHRSRPSRPRRDSRTLPRSVRRNAIARLAMQHSAARPAPVPSPLLTNFLLAILCLVWGSTWLVIKVGLEELPPLGSAGVRFIVAGVTMALVCTWLARREGGGRPPVSAVLAHGLCQFVLNYALVYASETVLPSGLVSVLWSIFPLAMAFTGHFVTRSEPLRAQQWIGFVVAFLGIVVLFVTDVARISARAIAMGLLLLLAPLSVTFSTTFVKTRAA